MNNLTEIFLKSRTGVYKDTPENRRLHRVGMKYGAEKQAQEPEQKSAKGADSPLTSAEKKTLGRMTFESQATGELIDVVMDRMGEEKYYDMVEKVLEEGEEGNEEYWGKVMKKAVEKHFTPKEVRTIMELYENRMKPVREKNDPYSFVEDTAQALEANGGFGAEIKRALTGITGAKEGVKEDARMNQAGQAGNVLSADELRDMKLSMQVLDEGDSWNDALEQAMGESRFRAIFTEELAQDEDRWLSNQVVWAKKTLTPNKIKELTKEVGTDAEYNPFKEDTPLNSKELEKLKQAVKYSAEEGSPLVTAVRDAVGTKTWNEKVGNEYHTDKYYNAIESFAKKYIAPNELRGIIARIRAKA